MSPNNSNGEASGAGFAPGFAVLPSNPMEAITRTQQVEAETFERFWIEKMKEIEECSTDPADFKTQQLPLARIKKIMKSDEDVRMISAEAPVLFAKGCELFIAELTKRAWLVAQENSRRTIQRSDVATAVHRTEIFDFLIDVVPKEEIEGGMAPAPNAAGAPAALGGYPAHMMRPAKPGEVMPAMNMQMFNPYGGMMPQQAAMYQQMAALQQQQPAPPDGDVKPPS